MALPLESFLGLLLGTFGAIVDSQTPGKASMLTIFKKFKNIKFVAS